jgi:hypothetical protein
MDLNDTDPDVQFTKFCRYLTHFDLATNRRRTE